jgi:hypothetical protein
MHNAMQTVESQPMFQSSMAAASSGYKRKIVKESAWSRRKAILITIGCYGHQ